MHIGYECVTLKGGFWQFVREKNAHVSLKNVYRRFVETGRFRALQCEKQEVPPHIFYDKKGLALGLRGAEDVKIAA